MRSVAFILYILMLAFDLVLATMRRYAEDQMWPVCCKVLIIIIIIIRYLSRSPDSA